MAITRTRTVLAGRELTAVDLGRGCRETDGDRLPGPAVVRAYLDGVGHALGLFGLAGHRNPSGALSMRSALI